MLVINEPVTWPGNAPRRGIRCHSCGRFVNFDPVLLLASPQPTHNPTLNKDLRSPQLCMLYLYLLVEPLTNRSDCTQTWPAPTPHASEPIMSAVPVVIKKFTPAAQNVKNVESVAVAKQSLFDRAVGKRINLLLRHRYCTRVDLA